MDVVAQHSAGTSPFILAQGKVMPGIIMEKMKNNRIFLLAALLLALFLGVYSLTYSGTFITDDEHILSSRSLSMAFDGNVNDDRVFGNSRVYALSNLPGEQAVQALNIEPGQEFLGALLARLSVLLQTGRVQTLFLLNIWVTALAGVVLFLVSIGMGYSNSTAILLAIFFGLGSLAWPYSRTYFRDSLAMLFLLTAWGCMEIILHHRPDLNRKYIHFAWLVLPFTLAAGIFTKNTVTIAVPIILLEILFNRKTIFHFPKIRNLHIGKLWAIIILALGTSLLLAALWALIHWLQPLFARFSPQYYSFLIQFFLHSPHPNFWAALAGPFISPGKSIFIFSPVLIISLVGLFRATKSSWSAWGYFLLLVIAQALFYDQDWWGHINWGLRFSLPAIPLLVLASAPVMEKWSKSIGGKIGLALIGSISVAIQLVGVLPPLLKYYTNLSAAIPPVSEIAAQWNIKYSALLWNIKGFLSGETFDLAAVRLGAASLPFVLGLCAGILLAILGIFRAKRTWYGLSLLLISAILVFYIPMEYKNDPVYQYSRTDLRSAQTYISGSYQVGDRILLKSYGAPAWDYWMNWTGPSLPWTALPFYFPSPGNIEAYLSSGDPEIAMDAITLSLLDQIPREGTRIWLVLPSDSPGGNLDMEVDWLKSHGTLLDSQAFSGDSTQTRVFLFVFNGDTMSGKARRMFPVGKLFSPGRTYYFMPGLRNINVN